MDWSWVKSRIRSADGRAYCAECRRWTRSIDMESDVPVHQFLGERHLVLPTEPAVRMYLGLDKLDLIELPVSKGIRHYMPVPAARRIIGINAIASIEVPAKRWRHDKFFTCPQCYGMRTDSERTLGIQGKSFYRCVEHNPIRAEERNADADILRSIVLSGKFRRLWYIRSGPGLATAREHRDMRCYNGTYPGCPGYADILAKEVNP